MAKRPVQYNPLEPTTPPAAQPEQPGAAGDNADLDSGRIISSGVGITTGELAALDDLAKRYQTSRNALMHTAVRLFLEAVRAGKINLDDLLTVPEPPKRQPKFRKRVE